MFDLEPRVGDHLLHELLTCQRLALRVPRQGAFAHHVEGPLGETHRTHRVVDPPSTEPSLCNREALATLAEHVAIRYAHVRIADVRVHALFDRMSVESDVADDVDSLRVRRHDEHRSSLVTGCIGVGDCHDDQERREVRVRREPLLAVDHPVIAVLDGRRGELGRIGSALGFGHREARDDVVAEQ